MPNCFTRLFFLFSRELLEERSSSFKRTCPASTSSTCLERQLQWGSLADPRPACSAGSDVKSGDSTDPAARLHRPPSPPPLGLQGLPSDSAETTRPCAAGQHLLNSRGKVSFCRSKARNLVYLLYPGDASTPGRKRGTTSASAGSNSCFPPPASHLPVEDPQ